MAFKALIISLLLSTSVRATGCASQTFPMTLDSGGTENNIFYQMDMKGSDYIVSGFTQNTSSLVGNYR